MMLERMRNFEMLGPRPCPRRLDLGNGGHDETEVVEHLRIRATMRAAMKRQVVASGGQRYALSGSGCHTRRMPKTRA